MTGPVRVDTSKRHVKADEPTEVLTYATGWAPLTKRERLEDGTLLVYGQVANDGLDRDLQRLDNTWLDEALPDWFTSSGNVREMHQSNAVGRGITYDKADRTLVAHIVDPVSIIKVDNEVLQGFSVGIKRPKIVSDPTAPGGRVVGGTICEVSIVDRPSNPTTLFTVAKSDEADTLVLVGDPHVTDADGEVVTEPTPGARLATALTAEADESAARTFLAAAAERGIPVPEVLALKADLHDATMLAAIRTGLIACIRAELEEWSKGEPEQWDVTQLVEALCMFLAWWQDEAWEGEVAEPTATDETGAAVAKVDAADVTKDDDAPAPPPITLGAQPTPEQVAALAGAFPGSVLHVTGADGEIVPVEAVEKADTPDLIKTLLAEDGPLLSAVTESITKAVGPLAERLAKVESTPTQGGPVRMRTDQGKADVADTASLAKADRYEQQAAAFDNVDRVTADGYRRLAQQARDSAR